MGRRVAASVQRRSVPVRRHSPRLHRLRRAPVPQHASMADSVGIAPPLSAAAHHLRSEPYRRQARADRPAVAESPRHGLRRPDHREPLPSRLGVERRPPAGHARESEAYSRRSCGARAERHHRKPRHAAPADRQDRQQAAGRVEPPHGGEPRDRPVQERAPDACGAARPLRRHHGHAHPGRRDDGSRPGVHARYPLRHTRRIGAPAD